MIKTITRISFLILAAVLMTSCSKDSDPTPDPTPVVSDKVTITTQPTTAIDVNGGTATATFTANSAWTATVSSTASSWCSVSPASGTAGTGTITITAAQNTTYDERNAAITIKSGTATQAITVTQKQLDALTVTSNKVEVAAEGREAKIEVKANVTYSYEIASDATWIKKVAATKALSTTTIALQIDENSNTTAREGKVTITSGALKEEVTIYQAGAKPSIVLTSKDYTIGSDGGNIKVELKSNVTYTYSIIEGKDWISEATTKAMSDYTHTFTIAANTTYDNREGKVVFQNKENNLTDTIKITQVQKDAIILAKSEYTVDGDATTLEFDVESNVAYTVETSASWIKRDASTKALTKSTLKFTIDKYEGDDVRTATITVKYQNIEQKITVNQQGGIPYLTFSADTPQSVCFKDINNASTSVATIEYSLNGSDWAEMDTREITFGGANGKLRLRGKSSIGTAVSVSSYAKFVFGNSSVPVSCSGDIRTLVDYSNYKSCDTSNAKFCYLFCDTPITSAPVLSATKLADYCYLYMFHGCTNLTIAPELPATTLANSCYNSMFLDCKSLTTAPELPATTLAKGCYSSMFFGCTSLKKTPDLPAVTLSESCYLNMFNGCKSLTTAPDLPATTLATNCYGSMFLGCTGLTVAPKLSVTTLADYCYYQMFWDCTSLTKSPELPATILTVGCYNGMFYGCKSLTEAPELPAETLANSCYYNMFMGCTCLTEAPKLPARTLASNCYHSMFRNCTGLTRTPALPATTIASNCYHSMFQGCTGITGTPELAAETLAKSCYESMFSGCIKLTQISKLSARNLADCCYLGMFSNCTNLTNSPSLPVKTLAKSFIESMFSGCSKLGFVELPATTLAERCYYQMFKDCYRQNHIKMMATNISAYNCLYQWVTGVSSTGTFVKNKAATWNVSGENGIPEGWTVQTATE